MTAGVGQADGLSSQLTAARVLAPTLEVQHLKASVRAHLFGIVDAPTVLGGHTIRRLIGRGGMGAVYEASDERGEIVALKTLHGFDPAALFRLKQEFRALADLDHPNLVGLHHLVAAGDQVFVTMESIDGRDFLAEVQAGTPVAALLPQLIAGVSALHAAGKLHRDLKPSNVLVTPAGRVVILDFGLVQECGGPRGELMGTPAYMAPELLLGAAATPASDWYSVGVMLYEALTDRLPFAGDGVTVLKTKLTAEPPLPFAADIDPTLACLCGQLLARDPERRAGPRDILRALGSSPTRAVAVVAAPRGVPLVGRADALAVLHDALADVRAGTPALVLVRGGSGVGKSTLAQAFLERLGPSTVVLCGRCYEREQVPHNAFDSLVDALTGHLLGLPAADQAAALSADVVALAHLFPVLRRLPAVAAAHQAAQAHGPEDMPEGTVLRDRAYQALRTILAWLGARASVVLHIDDLQWADGDSAVLLAELAAAAPPGCLLLISLDVDASGPGPIVQDLLRRLAAAAVDLRELRLGPLGPADSLTLAHALLAASAQDPEARAALADDAAAVARESAGLPLFVHELAHHVRDDLSSGTAVRACRLEDLITARTSRLPSAARLLLATLALAGRPLPVAFAGRLIADPLAGHAALRQLRAARLVRTRRTDRGELVEIHHDRIRETVIAGLDAAQLRDCHRRLADALPSGADDELEAVAHHLRAAGQHERARAAMQAAAHQAARNLAFHRAAELLLAAIDLSPVTDADGRRALRVEAGTALAGAGRREEAANCFLAAAAGAPPQQALELRRRAAETLLGAGDVERGRAQLEHVLTALGCQVPRSPAARKVRAATLELRLRLRGLGFAPRREAEIPEQVLIRLDTLRAARFALIQHDPAAASLYQLDLLLQALEIGEPGRIARALAGHAAHLSLRGHASAAVCDPLMTHTRRLVARHGLDDATPFVDLCAGLIAFNTGAWRSAVASLDAAGLPLAHAAAPTPEASARGVLVGVCGNWALGSLFHLGDLVELTRRRRVFLDLVREVGDRPSEDRLHTSWQVFAALADDDPASADESVARVTRRWPAAAFPHERAYATLVSWAVAVYTADGPRAWTRVAADWPAYVRSYMYLGQYGQVSGEFWRGAAALQAARVAADPRPLLAVAASAERVITRARARWAAPLASLLRAGIASQSSRTDRAHAELAVAIAGFEAHDMHLWAAAARWHAARLAGDRDREATASARMSALGASNPARMAACLVPVA